MAVERQIMKRLLALIQVVFIFLVIGFGTYHLFKGNFEVAFASLPLLMAYYVFVTVRLKRTRSQQERDSTGE